MVVIVAVSVGLLAIWWAGLLAPRVSAEHVANHHDTATGAGSVEIAIVNDAPTSLRLHAVTLTSDASRNITVRSATLGGQDVTTGPSLAGGGRYILQIDYDTAECTTIADTTWLSATVEVETSLGRVLQESLPTGPTNGTSSIGC